VRAEPGQDALALLTDFRARAADLDKRLKTRDPDCGVAFEVLADVPPMAPEGGAAEAFVRGLTGDNGAARTVAFASEGGQFQGAGFSTVICGPARSTRPISPMSMSRSTSCARAPPS